MTQTTKAKLVRLALLVGLFVLVLVGAPQPADASMPCFGAGGAQDQCENEFGGHFIYKVNGCDNEHEYWCCVDGTCCPLPGQGPACCSYQS